ncbi:DNA ligase 4-like, partial [Trifolium medium]|nr:DNA ligase 4-like [Trifolium medium]
EHDLAADAHLAEDNVEDRNESFSNKGSKQSSAKAASQDSLALASQEK